MADYSDAESIHHDFVATYGSAYVQLVEHLRHRLIDSETGENHFAVVPIEAGLGKSIQSDRLIAEAIRQGNRRRFLIVKDDGRIRASAYLVRWT